MASIDELQRVYSFPAQTKLVLGRAFGQSALAGYVGGLNIWGTILEKRTIVALYRGNGRESGNVFSWFALKDDIPGALLPLKEAINSEDVHKGISHEDVLKHFSWEIFPRSCVIKAVSLRKLLTRSDSGLVNKGTLWYNQSEKSILYHVEQMNQSYTSMIGS